MEYANTDSIRKAFNLFLNLIEKTEIKKSDDPALFNEYEDPEVSYLVHLMEEEANILIIRSGDTLYFSPRIDNDFFGFTNAELRNALRVSNNTELYAVYVIMLAIIIKFYNGENYNNKCRTMLKVEELEKYITQKMETISRLENDEGILINSAKEDSTVDKAESNVEYNPKDSNETSDEKTNKNATGQKTSISKSTADEKLSKNTINQPDEKLSYNFSSVAKLWLNLPAYDEKIVQYSLSAGTRISLIFKTIKFLKEQGLANIDNENEIFTTSKMDALIMGYYPENNRKKEILSFLDGK